MITLQTTDTQLAALAEIEDSARKGTTTLKVDREALRALLRDHYTLYQAALRQRHRFDHREDQESLA
jgi:hypothetical protein